MHLVCIHKFVIVQGSYPCIMSLFWYLVRLVEHGIGYFSLHEQIKLLGLLLRLYTHSEEAYKPSYEMETDFRPLFSQLSG